MNRSFLRWFYVCVQFVMLAVSIPKVATLFQAYDPQTMGPLVADVDLRSWLVGIAIDLTATFTTWAAMAKFDETRKRTALLAPGLIIGVCTSLSVVANYEDAATLRPEQYADVSLFTHPALLINPVLISAPPVLVLLLILLVPSVLARPRVRTAAEIEAEADEEAALLVAKGRVSVIRAQQNAKVRSARMQGFQDNLRAVTGQAEETVQALPAPERKPRAVEADESVPGLPSTKAMWNTLSVKERVVKGGVISVQEIAEVLSISLSHARNLAKEVKAEPPHVPGRTGVSYEALIEALYEKRSKDSFAQAQKLESALGMRKKRLQAAQEVSDAATDATSLSNGRGAGDDAQYWEDVRVGAGEDATN